MTDMEKFEASKREFVFPVCNTCKNYLKDLSCRAFDRIPDEILEGRNDHSLSMTNDRGIQFESQ